MWMYKQKKLTGNLLLMPSTWRRLRHMKTKNTVRVVANQSKHAVFSAHQEKLAYERFPTRIGAGYTWL